MKILIVSQVFYPDTVSVAQHFSDFTISLKESGHEVDVLTSRYNYEKPSISYSRKEDLQGIRITRFRHSRFSKNSIIGRVCNFLTFNMVLFFRLVFIKKRKYDLICSSTVPPLNSLFCIWTAKWKKSKYCFWLMDMQPELSIQSGLIKKNSFQANTLSSIGKYIIKKSDRIIVLDRFMKDEVVRKGAAPEKVDVIPVWPVMSEVYEGSREDNPFRKEQEWGNKIVVMYSGNHAYVHPLDTLLETARDLQHDERFLFAFIGGGVRTKDVALFKEKNNLHNIIQLPFQPREKIHWSLGSSDIQVVILGDGQVGYTHPNKVYGAMFIGKPVLYIGPVPSHVSDIFDACPGNICVQHGQHSQLTTSLLNFAAQIAQEWEKTGSNNRAYANTHFIPAELKRQMVQSAEQCIK